MIRLKAELGGNLVHVSDVTGDSQSCGIRQIGIFFAFTPGEEPAQRSERFLHRTVRLVPREKGESSNALSPLHAAERLERPANLPRPRRHLIIPQRPLAGLK